MELMPHRLLFHLYFDHRDRDILVMPAEELILML